jgi:hypothetical protein
MGKVLRGGQKTLFFDKKVRCNFRASAAPRRVFGLDRKTAFFLWDKGAPGTLKMSDSCTINVLRTFFSILKSVFLQDICRVRHSKNDFIVF